MRPLVAALLALISTTACGSHPGAPSLLPVRLTMVVMGNNTRAPIVGAPVSLRGVPGSERRTDATGRASWSVPRNAAYAVAVCGIDTAPAMEVPGDTEWLTSLPESQCGQ